jgi:hypothetical protein
MTGGIGEMVQHSDMKDDVERAEFRAKFAHVYNAKADIVDAVNECSDQSRGNVGWPHVKRDDLGTERSELDGEPALAAADFENALAGRVESVADGSNTRIAAADDRAALARSA